MFEISIGIAPFVPPFARYGIIAEVGVNVATRVGRRYGWVDRGFVGWGLARPNGVHCGHECRAHTRD